MRLRRFALTFLVSMFAFASGARGDTAAAVHWLRLRSVAESHCVDLFLKSFEAREILSANARVISDHLCHDDRIYFNMAFALSAEAREPDPRFDSNRHRKRYRRAQLRKRNNSLAAVDQLGERFVLDKHFSPITVGLVGASKSEIEEILETLRELRHPWSERIFRWHNNPSAFRDWRTKQLRGGVLPGLIHAHVAKNNAEDLLHAQALLEATFTQHSSSNSLYTNDFTEYTLVLTSDEDISDKLNPVDGPISWLNLQKSSCEVALSL